MLQEFDLEATTALWYVVLYLNMERHGLLELEARLLMLSRPESAGVYQRLRATLLAGWFIFGSK